MSGGSLLVLREESDESSAPPHLRHHAVDRSAATGTTIPTDAAYRSLAQLRLFCSRVGEARLLNCGYFVIFETKGAQSPLAGLENCTVAMFELYATPVEHSIGDIEGLPMTTFLCGGIVNPFGPTLSAIACLGEFGPDRTLPLVYVMLNPFSQLAMEIGRCVLGHKWVPLEDMMPLLSFDLGDCPSLFLPSGLLAEGQAIEIHAAWLQRAPYARYTWKYIMANPGDPWSRVNKSTSAAFEKYALPYLRGEQVTDSLWAEDPEWQVPLDPEEALKFSEYLLSPGHMEPELQALCGAWRHAIDSQRSAGGRLPVTMDFDRFVTWLTTIGRTCRLPSTAH